MQRQSFCAMHAQLRHHVQIFEGMWRPNLPSKIKYKSTCDNNQILIKAWYWQTENQNVWLTKPYNAQVVAHYRFIWKW